MKMVRLLGTLIFGLSFSLSFEAFAEERVSLIHFDQVISASALELQPQESDFYFSLGHDSQLIERESLNTYWNVFDHLASQNDQEYFRNPLPDFQDFISKVNRTRHPFLTINQLGEAKFVLGKEVNVFKNLDAIGSIQTNRPPQYLKNGFYSGDALDLPRWLIHYLIFAKRAPPRLSAALEKLGYSQDDYFVIYSMPQNYDWAIGERLPLLPLIFPRSILRDRGFDIDQLDFETAQVVFPQEAIAHFEKTGDASDLGSAGIHIPIKNSSGQEFFLPFSILTKLTSSAHAIFLMSVGLSNSRNFEELIGQVEALSEEIVRTNFENFNEAEKLGTFMSALLAEAIIHPTHLPDDRVKNRHMSVNGPFSKITRTGFRFIDSFRELIKKTSTHAGREEGKTLAEDRLEYRELLENFKTLQEEALKSFSYVQRGKTWGGFSQNQEQSESSQAPKTGFEKWRQRLILSAICAIPLGVVSHRLIPILASEWSTIMPYASLGGLFATATASAFIFYSYLRNVSIRDARAEGMLYESDDPRLAKILERIDSSEHHSKLVPEMLRLEREIQIRNRQKVSSNPLKAGFQKTFRFFKNLSAEAKRRMIKTWYDIEGLEKKAEFYRENPERADEKSALQLFGSVMARAFGAIYLFPWHRTAVSALFPFYFETRERGGRASLSTWQDQGLWPSPYYIGLKLATQGLGLLYPAFKPSYFWKKQAKARDQLIEESALIEPAISQAVRQLEIAKALQLGMDYRLIPSILSVERHIHQEGFEWLKKIQKDLPKYQQLSDPALKELIFYSNEIMRASLEEDLFEQLKTKLHSFEADLSSYQKIENLSVFAKNWLIERYHQVLNSYSEESEFYQDWKRQIGSRWMAFRLKHHETFFRLGKNGENLTRTKSLMNLGNYPYTHLQDRLIITAQVVPMIASKSLGVDMTEEELFNGLAPIFLFLGPDNLSSYGSGLAISSGMIDKLIDQRLRNENQTYFRAVWQSFKRAPWRKITLQSASMLDLRILSAANSSLLMVGMLYPIDLAIASWASVFDGQEFGSEIMATGAGRVANGIAGAGVNLAFSVGSIPFYRTLMFLRREAGGIGLNGYQSIGRQNPHENADRIFFASSQAILNILYGVSAGVGIPLLSEKMIDLADIQLPNEIPLEGKSAKAVSDCIAKIKETL
ncbi:MAG: hypothetical protein ACO3LE_02590 [Bdellovibrionota bacterium]